GLSTLRAAHPPRDDRRMGEEAVVAGLTVVGVNGSAASERALIWAADRVAERGGRLEVLCVVDLMFGAALYGSHFDPVANASAILEDAERATRLRHPDLDVTTKWLDGRPSRELIRRSRAAGLIVIGTDKLPTTIGPRIGTLPLQLAAKADCPVAVIPELGTSARRGVVVGVDRSAESASALAVAVQEASWLDADVIALHAWDVPPVFQRGLDADLRPDPHFEEAERRVVPETIRNLGFHEDARIVSELVRENPAVALIERARKAQLLVMGTRGRGRLASSVLGSVSHDVLVNIASPVIIVGEPYGFVAPGMPAGTEEDW
ncbi:MAG TPA: universal stress protein, partial [Leifsonia sp.]|nr:universal stress protein [Leifsonia sp.]